ncbi:MAG: NUDIX hydrolase [Verrucomicrobiota bacterium]
MAKPAPKHLLKTSKTANKKPVVLKKKTAIRKNARSSSIREPNKEVSVMAWIVNNENQILMVRQARGKKSWALPGGKVKQRESIEAGLKREVFEETGLVVEKLRLIDIYDRGRRGTLSLLYFVKLRPTRMQLRRPEEISEISYHKNHPANCTQTAEYYWTRWHNQAFLRNPEFSEEKLKRSFWNFFRSR